MRFLPLVVSFMFKSQIFKNSLVLSSCCNKAHTLLMEKDQLPRQVLDRFLLNLFYIIKKSEFQQIFDEMNE